MSFTGTIISLNEKLQAMVGDKTITPEAAEILSNHVVGQYNEYLKLYVLRYRKIPDGQIMST